MNQCPIRPTAHPCRTSRHVPCHGLTSCWQRAPQLIMFLIIALRHISANDNASLEWSSTHPRYRRRSAAPFSRSAGKLVEAEQLCQQIINVKRDVFDALHLLAIVQASLDKKDLALVSYDRALTIRPDNAEALSNHSLTLHGLSGSRKRWRATIARSPYGRTTPRRSTTVATPCMSSSGSRRRWRATTVRWPRGRALPTRSAIVASPPHDQGADQDDDGIGRTARHPLCRRRAVLVRGRAPELIRASPAHQTGSMRSRALSPRSRSIISANRFDRFEAFTG